MQLSTRLLLFGALLPVLSLAGALGIGGMLFSHVLHENVDRALLVGGAVESVSLFDRAGGPHLHLNISPFDPHVREFAPLGALYGPTGELITRYPEDARVPSRLDPTDLPTEPSIQTQMHEGSKRRVLLVRVLDAQQRPHGLWLASPLESVDAAIDAYWRIAGAMIAAVAVLLLLLQTWHARTLDRRVSQLARHMERIRAGDLSEAPPPDPASDVVGELRDAIDVATTRLRLARSSQDRLVADAAHELRTPLTAMRAAIDVALRRERSISEIRETMGRLREEVDRLSTLAGRLLDMAALRGGALDARRGNLTAVLEEAVDAARAFAEERNIIVMLRAPAHALAQFAAGPIRQALDNLLVNAIKHSPERGTIDVILGATDTGWQIRVRDQGRGVPEAVREAIFEPFHRAERKGEGAGLGLAIVRDVAERHGGTCYVAPTEGRGATFVLELPGTSPPAKP